MISMTKGDKILIIAVVIISLVSLGFINKSGSAYNKKYISVQVNGEEYKKIIFDKSLIGKTVEIETEFGYNIIEVGDEEVRVIEASCPDKLDVLQGTISRPGELIVCLPNRLVIEIVGAEEAEENEVDHISR